MYHHLHGTLVRKAPSEAIVDVGGVGYRVTIPLSTYDALPARGGEVTLLTEMVVRDDSHRLFGFAEEAERSFFVLLQSVTGVGPQLALGIISALRYEEFHAAVAAGEAPRLQRVKGVGKRLSERLVVELRDRLGDAEAMPGAGAADATSQDASLALEALGYTRAAAEKAVADVRAETPDLDSGALVRAALQRL